MSCEHFAPECCIQDVTLIQSHLFFLLYFSTLQYVGGGGLFAFQTHKKLMKISCELLFRATAFCYCLKFIQFSSHEIFSVSGNKQFVTTQSYATKRKYSSLCEPHNCKTQMSTKSMRRKN